jgi:hypothetical protein
VTPFPRRLSECRLPGECEGAGEEYRSHRRGERFQHVIPHADASCSEDAIGQCRDPPLERLLPATPASRGVPERARSRFVRSQLSLARLDDEVGHPCHLKTRSAARSRNRGFFVAKNHWTKLARRAAGRGSLDPRARRPLVPSSARNGILRAAVRARVQHAGRETPIRGSRDGPGPHVVIRR